MARLWSTGFELQSVTSGIEWDTTTGSLTINTSTKRSGAAALRTNPSAAIWNIKHQVRADSTALIYVRFYLYITTAPAATTTIFKYGDGSYNPLGIRLTSGRLLQVWDDEGSQVGNSSAALNTGQWYRIEVSHNDATGDVFHAYVDGVEFATGAVGDIGGGGFIFLGVLNSATCDLYFDDVAVNDGSGSYQTGLPGEGSIKHLNPAADGDYHAWLKQGGGAGDANNYQSVDEITPDDATSYLKTTTLNAQDMYKCGASGIGASDTVTLVAVGSRIACSATTSPTLKLQIEKTAGGTPTQGTATTPTSTSWTTHNPAAPKIYQLTTYVTNTGEAWTQATLDTMQIGYKETTDQTAYVYVSTIWALVEYVPSAHKTKTHTLDGIVQVQGNTKTHTQDGIVQVQGNTKTYTLDGLVVSRSSPTHTLDGIVKVLGNTKTHTLDGIVQVQGNTKTHTLDGIVKVINSPTYTLDGIVKVLSNTKTHTLDGIVLVTSTKTNTLDGIVKATTTTTYTLDGIVVNRTQTTHSLDGIVKVLNNTTTHTLDGIVAIRNQTTYTLDGIVRATSTITHTLDGVVIISTGTNYQNYSLDGIVLATSQATHTLDGLLIQRNTATYTIDGIVKVINTATYTADGIVKVISSPTCTLDGIVKATSAATYSLDGIVKATSTSAIQLDGIVSIRKTATMTIDAIVKIIQTKTNTLDGMVKATSQKMITIDGDILATLLITYTADGLVIFREVVLPLIPTLLTHQEPEGIPKLDSKKRITMIPANDSDRTIELQTRSAKIEINSIDINHIL